ncbi:MAG: class I SAM-dependent rRNA methyltransferase [Nitrospirae bacterium]|nr:class I SAM-dependent rRNA methyltransferase [Nitrospirota bacterium]
MKTLRLKPGEDRRIREGHPWVFANESASPLSGYQAGETVDVEDAQGEFIGRGYVNPHSLIAARILTRRKEAIDQPFFRRRLERALAYRERVCPGANAYRLCYSEGDHLPGIIVDRYGGVYVLQILTAGMEALLEEIQGAIHDLFAPRAIVARNDLPSRKLEGLPQEKRVLSGEIPSPLVARVGEVEMEVDALEGQKTGLFLDQRENYRLLQGRVAGKRILDLFCYTGGWALHAARWGAEEVVGVDGSARAVEEARWNAERNMLSPCCRFVQEEVFEGLRSREQRGERFDVVILDPPAFVKSRSRIREALKGYREVNRRAIRLLSPGGLLMTSSCSYHLEREAFREMLRRAAAEAGREVRLLEMHGQARDHPVLLAVPETEYLKCAVLEVYE